MPADAMVETRRRGGMPMLVARRSIMVAGVERLYLLAVPTTYDANSIRTCPAPPSMRR
jgi:hypothetical protein